MKKIEQVLSPRFIIVQGTLVALRNRNIQFALFILIFRTTCTVLDKGDRIVVSTEAVHI